MSTFEKLMSTALLLVFVYLILINSRNTTSVLGSAGTQLTNIFKTLQGR